MELPTIRQTLMFYGPLIISCSCQLLFLNTSDFSIKIERKNKQNWDKNEGFPTDKLAFLVARTFVFQKALELKRYSKGHCAFSDNKKTASLLPFRID